MRKRILEFVAKKGTLIEPEAAEYLLKLPDPLSRLASVMGGFGDPPLVLTLHDVIVAERIATEAASHAVIRGKIGRVIAPETELGEIVPGELVEPKTLARHAEPATNYDENLVVLRDITGHSTCEGTIDDFSRLFLNRFRVLAAMLRQRRDLAGATEISKAKRLGREVSIIGMVGDVRSTKNGHRIVEIEDETDRMSVFLPASTPVASSSVVTDEVIGVSGNVNGKQLLIANSLVQPDVPTTHRQPRCNENVSVAFVSDAHVGSKFFLQERWENFRAWIADGDELAKSIKYVIMAGDLVDGIGIYPRQDEDLAIDDIYAQYEELARLISELPPHLRIVMSPGNHDAVRPAEPQPALPDGIRKLLPSNALCVGNPCMLSIHGVKVLMYHGRSMDDLVGAIPDLSYANPLDAMKNVLQMRHLAPIYGGRTPIAPEAHDLMVIDEVPDIFVTGHVHGVGVGEYRGVTLINSSAWQSQTSYQKMRNLKPTPCRVPIMNLCSGRITIKEF